MSCRWPIRSALAALLALPALVQAQAVHYELDPVHTRVMFAVSHAGFSSAIGTVSGSTGRLLFDPADWSSARVDARIPLSRLDLGDARWNRAALAAALLDSADHPDATFVSSRVEPIDARHASLHGTLTLRGVAREVKLDLVFNAAKRHPMPPFRRTAGFSASGKIRRSDFGMTAWQGVVGDEVELRIEAEATRVSAGDAAAGTEVPAVPDPPPPLPPPPPADPATPPGESAA